MASSSATTARRRREGRCPECEKVTGDGSRCYEHARKNRSKQRGYRRKYPERSIAHLAKLSAKQAERRAKGQCLGCGLSSPTFTRCLACRENYNQYQRERHAAKREELNAKRRERWRKKQDAKRHV